jgi:hypothetical protein
VTTTISPETIEDIQRLIDDGIQESLHLDYKDGRGLTKKSRDEVVKDVTAFANADGGVIVYGVEEDGHLPIRIDGGVNDSDMNREWLDQIIAANVTPTIEGIKIRQIPHTENRSLYVVEIPKSYRGPHQSSDKKYYKRYNFRSSPMDHYEIFDIANRKSRAPTPIKIDVEIVRYMVRLTIENIGNYPVHDVKFKFPDGFSWPAGREFPRVFERGVRYFPSGKKFSYYYQSSHSVFDEKGVIAKEFEIHVSYVHPEIGQKISDEFYINLDDYYGTTFEADPDERLTRALNEGFRILRDSLNAIGRARK